MQKTDNNVRKHVVGVRKRDKRKVANMRDVSSDANEDKEVTDISMLGQIQSENPNGSRKKPIGNSKTSGKVVKALSQNKVTDMKDG